MNEEKNPRKQYVVYIVICLVLLMTVIAIPALAQNKTVKGTVVDGDNLPIIGATVKVKGTASGAITDFNGHYRIQAKTGETLEFTYVG